MFGLLNENPVGMAIFVGEEGGCPIDRVIFLQSHFPAVAKTSGETASSGATGHKQDSGYAPHLSPGL